MNHTVVFKKNIQAYRAKKHIIANKGSTRSSKTWSILQLLYYIAEASEKPLLISVVSESFPHLSKGCIRDFENMLRADGLWFENDWNATNKIYKINHSKIEFFSADTPGKVHGPSRDILYVNECINISYEIYRHLAIRTTGTIFLDCNPCYEFWLDEKVLPRDDSVLIHSTYKDNAFLTSTQIREIESNMDDAEWWKVYGLGLTGSKIGIVMQNWDIITAIPDYAVRHWIGIDFGFSNDPTAISDVYLADGQLWINELLYEKKYDNPMISEYLSSCGVSKQTSIVADSAEPKSISEIQSFGWNIEPAIKGADSIKTGLSILNRYQKHITQQSVNIIKEYRNYRWAVDDDGNPTNKPIDKWNHSIDSQRYVALNKLASAIRPFEEWSLQWV